MIRPTKRRCRDWSNRNHRFDPSSRLISYTCFVPFTVEFAGEVPNPRPVEQALHNAFRDHRINPKREFFEIEPDQPIEMLRAFGVVDVTSTVSQEIDSSASESERNSRDRLSKRRPVFNFFEMGIPVGSELTFEGDGETIVIVTDERQVSMNGTLSSLTAATRAIKGTDYDVQPAPHWRFEGRLLRESTTRPIPSPMERQRAPKGLRQG